VTLGKVFIECLIKVLGKEAVTDVLFAELSLPSFSDLALLAPDVGSDRYQS
jgi:hypothetical protein